MDKTTTYINEALSVIEYVKAKISSSWHQDIKEKYCLKDVATYFSSDIMHDEEEFMFVKKALELDTKAVYIYNEKTEYTDRLADFGTTLFIDEQNYRVFLMISDFHLWFYDNAHFHQLLMHNKLIFMSSPILIIKSAPAESLRVLAESSFGGFSREIIYFVFGCTDKVTSALELYGFVYKDCLDKNELEMLVFNNDKTLDEGYIFFNIWLAFQKKCFIGITSQLHKKFFTTLPQIQEKEKSGFMCILEKIL